VDILINGTPQASTSGTDLEFTIPSGVKRIEVAVRNLSVSTAAAATGLQLEDATSQKTAGYVSNDIWLGDGNNAGANTNISIPSARFQVRPSSLALAADTFTGIFTLLLIDSATHAWVCNWLGMNTGSSELVASSGSIALSSELIAIHMTTSGTAFDGGSINIQYENPAPIVAEAVFLSGTVQPNVKIIDIGDWNMDSTAQVIVNHNLTLADIRNVSVLIRRDDDIIAYPLNHDDNATNIGGWFYVGSGAVFMFRSDPGKFSDTNFNATSFNRGWITITYV
jgi:hypothetical protein